MIRPGCLALLGVTAAYSWVRGDAVPVPTEKSVCVIGAGAGGLQVGNDLLELGVDYCIFEVGWLPSAWVIRMDRHFVLSVTPFSYVCGNALCDVPLGPSWLLARMVPVQSFPDTAAISIHLISALLQPPAFEWAQILSFFSALPKVAESHTGEIRYHSKACI